MRQLWTQRLLRSPPKVTTLSHSAWTVRTVMENHGHGDSVETSHKLRTPLILMGVPRTQVLLSLRALCQSVPVYTHAGPATFCLDRIQLLAAPRNSYVRVYAMTSRGRHGPPWHTKAYEPGARAFAVGRVRTRALKRAPFVHMNTIAMHQKCWCLFV